MNRTLVNTVANECLQKMISGEEITLNMIKTTLEEYQKEYKIFLTVIEEEKIISDICSTIYRE